ncbi:hypothetical protein EV283_2061 [Sphingomonas sp. BK036]|nr:hypothetical protein EV283_2061 [Sphingomonas sp. BK036]
MLPRSVSSAPIAAPATATPLKIAAAPHLPRALSADFTTGASGTIGRAEAGRGVLRLVERGFGTGFGTAFRGVDSADDFASDVGFIEAGFDGATGLAVEVAATDLGALVLRGARRRVTGFLLSVSGGSVSATAMLPQK